MGGWMEFLQQLLLSFISDHDDDKTMRIMMN